MGKINNKEILEYRRLLFEYEYDLATKSLNRVQKNEIKAGLKDLYDIVSNLSFKKEEDIIEREDLLADIAINVAYDLSRGNERREWEDIALYHSSNIKNVKSEVNK